MSSDGSFEAAAGIQIGIIVAAIVIVLCVCAVIYQTQKGQERNW
jgi:hypothetical protein